MKKLFTSLLILSCVFWTQMVSAQVSGYTFAQATGTTLTTANCYRQVGAGGVLAAANSGFYDDAAFSLVTLPWTVTYHGATFTTIGISPNGYASLGATAAGSYAATMNQANVLSPLSADLYANTSTAAASAECAYATTGDVGNRVFTVQWLNWGAYSGGLNEFSFQIKIYESGNKIQFVYNNGVGTNSRTAYVGLTGATTADFQTRTTTTNWAATTAGGANSSTCTVSSTVRPTNGLTFTWTSAATVAAMTFAQTTTTFVPIQAAVSSTLLTVSGTTYDDTNFGAQTIPFSFTYHGTVFTSIGVINPNGFIQLGTATAAGYAAISAYGDILSPLNADLYSVSAQSALGRNASVNVVGTTPNRVYVVQWTQWGAYSGGLNEFSFQVKLYETTNQVQFCYGPAPGVNSRTSYVGLTGTANSDFQSRTTTTNWAATTAGGSNSVSCTISSTVRPVNGLNFTWTPPSCTTPTALAATSITSSGASMTFTPGTGGTSYVIEYGPSATFTTAGSGATAGTGGTVLTGAASPIAITGLSPNTQYRVFIRKNCGAGNYSTNSTAVLFTTLQTPCSGTPPTGTAGVYQSVSATGFNADIVANGIGAVSSSTTATIDGLFNFAAPDFQATGSAAFQTNFLPSSRAINSTATPGMIFNLQPYNGNNVLRKAAGTNGTLTLSAPKAANAVNLLYVVGNGPAVCDITVTFSDATTQVFTAQSLVDWYSASNVAIQGVGRLDAAGTAQGSSTSPYMNQISLPISAANIAAGKQVASITVANTSAGTQVVNVFAVNLTTPVAPSASLCSPLTTAVSLGNAPGVGLSGITYQWQSSTTSGSGYANVTGGTGPTTTSYTTAALTSDLYYVCLVTCANGGGTALSNEVYVPVTTTPAAPTMSPVSASINQGQTASFTASGAGTTGFKWYDAITNGNLLASTAGYTTPPLCAGKTYYAEAQNGVCASASRTSAPVLMNSNFLAFTSNNIICGSGTVNLSCSNLSPAPLSYTWSNAATGTGPIPVSPTTSTLYTVSADFSTCTATASVGVGVIAASASSVPTATPASQCYSGTNTVSLNANVSSSVFSVSSIPYSAVAVPGSGVSTLVNSGTATPALQSGSLDDGGWSAIPLGFSYNFLGNVYSTVNVGTNGLLQFGAYNTTITQYSFPSGFPNTGYPTNVIAPMAMDLYFTGTGTNPGSIKYWNDGIAPTRRFIIQYSNVPNCCGTANPTETFQCILYETTGVVEVMVTSANSTNAKTIGLQDLAGTTGTTAPGRNAYTGTITTPEGWRFNPPANYTFTWSAAGGNPASATLSPNTHVVNPTISAITTPGTYVYNVAVTNPLTTCSNTSKDTFVIVPSPSSPTTLGDSTKCGPASVTFTVTSSYGADSVRWWTAATGGTLLSTSTSSTWATPTVTADTAYYGEIWNGTCASPRVRTVAHYANILGGTLTVTANPATATICLSGSVTLTASLSGATSYTWSPSTALSSTSGQTVTASPTSSVTYTVTANYGVCTVSASKTVNYVGSATTIAPTATPAVQCYAATDSVLLNSNLSTTAFSVAAIPYVATVVPGAGVTKLCDAGVAITPQATSSLDDGGWSSVPLGFSFNFFGNAYSSINVSTNGVLNFGPYASFNPSQFSFPSGIPSPSTPLNIIAAMACDLYFATSGTISYWTVGSAGNRVFHIYYQNAPGFITNGVQSSEVLLYEATGVVDIVIGGATSTAAKTIGAQGSTGLAGNGSTAPGRNAFTGTIGTEAWRFTPPATYTTSWVASGSNPAGATISSSSALNPIVTGFTNPGTYIYNFTATNNVTGCSATANDTFVINRTPATPTTNGATTLCGAYSVVFTSTGSPDSIQWYSAATAGTLVGGGSPWTTPLITADTAYYAMVTTGFCSSPRVRTAAVYTVPPAVSISGTNDLLCAGGTRRDTLTATGADPAYNYVWSATGTQSGAHGQTYSVLPTTTTIYSVTGSNTGTGCNTVATRTVQVNALPTAPSVAVSPNNVCPGSTVTLTSTPPAANYNVAPIPFAPVTSGTTTPLALGDESRSASIPIGFTFPFYGTNYTNLEVGSNGFVSFSLGTGLTFCCSGGFVPTVGQEPMIGFAWTDLNQAAGGTEDYFNLTSPNRFVVRFNGVFHFVGTQQVTTELILYQSGLIEVHTTSINNQGTVTIGMTNGTLGTAAPGINASAAYAMTNTAYRFSPPSGYSNLWTPNGTANYMAPGQETLFTATASPTSGTGNYVYTTTIKDLSTTCSNSANDTVFFSTTPNSNITGANSLCLGAAGSYNVVFSGAGPWTYAIDTVGGTLSGTTSSNTIAFNMAPGVSKTIRVTSLTDNSTGCSGVFADLDTQRIVVTTNCSITWLGGADTSWSNPNNWSPILVPNSCSVDVTVPAGTPNQPSITAANIQIGNLTLGNNVRVKLNNNKNLSVCKNFSGPSSAATAYSVSGSGKWIFNGTSAQTYSGYGNVDEVVINNTSGGVNFANLSYARLFVYRGLHLQSGNLANSNSGSVILLSSSSDTAAWLNNFAVGYTGTFTGKLTAQRRVATTGTTWQHQISSPVSGTGVTFYSLGQSTYGWHAAAPLIPSSNCSDDSINWTSPYSTALTWHESNVNVAVAGQPAICATRGWYTVGGPDQFGIGTGYNIYLTSASTPTLIGTPNTGNISVAGLTNSNWTVTSPEGHAYNSGWSLVGNPYPSSLDMAASPLSNGFDNQIQIFSPTGPFRGTYVPSILGSGRPVTIPSFQAFMVHKTATGGTATWQFLQAERSTGQGITYRFQKTSDANQLAVSVSGNGFNDATMIQFNDAATNAFDAEFDANKFASLHGQPTLYTLASGSNQWMGINVLGSFERSAIVPMGFEAGADGSFTFAVTADDLASFDPSVNVYLEDKQNPNNWINLRNNNSYTFSSKATDAKERFALHFEKTSASINEVASSNSNLNIFAVENKVLVDFTKLKNVDATIQIYNILGQELSNETHHASSTYVKAVDNVEAAYVIVRVKLADGTVTGSKLFITK